MLKRIGELKNDKEKLSKFRIKAMCMNDLKTARNFRTRGCRYMFKSLNKKRLCLLCIAAAAILLTGCADRQDDKAKVEYKKIVVGSDRYEPYVYQGNSGNYTGIDTEIAVEAFHRIGYEPEFKEIVWENKKDCLDNGEVDCLWGCFSMNGREDEYQWAGPYLYSHQVVVVRMDSDIYKISDLNGKDVAAQETSKAEEYLLRSLDENVPDVERVYTFSGMDEVYGALRKNYVSAICGHEGALNTLVKTAPNEYRMLDESLFVSRLGVAFSKDYDTSVVTKLEKALKGMSRDGTTAGIVEKYGFDAEKSVTGVTD